MQTHEYTVGWICAIPTESVVACAMLDEEHPPLEEQPRNDNNAYTLGSIGHHNVVIACLPKGKYGIASAASVAADMLNTFDSIRFGLMVGIAGGAPHDAVDLRLGDVVVGAAQKLHGGVVAYDFGRAVQEQEFEITRSLNSPPKLLLTALSQLETYHQLKGMSRLNGFLSRVTDNPRLRKRFGRPNDKDDRLYKASYVHPQQGLACSVGCDDRELRQRGERDALPGDNLAVHYGLIASADRVVRDAKLRDKLRQQHDVLCFDMEAAGLMDNFPCVVIRGICDYSDSHKDDIWQGYSAATAAAYAKELLHIISPAKVMRETTAAIVQTMNDRPQQSFSTTRTHGVRSRNARNSTFGEYPASSGSESQYSNPASRPSSATSLNLISNSRATFPTIPMRQDPEIVNHINTGQGFLDDKAKTPDLAERLKNAERHFSQARTQLLETRSTDIASLLLVYNGLMRVELNKTLVKAYSLSEKKESLRQAFYFNQVALDNASLMPHPETEVPRVQMRRAILVGRETEIDCRQPRVDSHLINEWRTNALKVLHDARHGMIKAGTSEVDRKLIAWADGWISRVMQISAPSV